MTTERVRYLVGLLSVLFVSCGSPSIQASTVYLDTNRVPVALRQDYASFAVNCSKCHGLSRAFNAGVTDTKHWDLYVARMVRTAGSSISHEEVPGILRFLYWYTTSYDRRRSFGSEAEVVAEPSPAPVLEAPPPAPDASNPALPGAPPSADPARPPETQNTVGKGQ